MSIAPLSNTRLTQRRRILVAMVTAGPLLQPDPIDPGYAVPGG